MKQKELSSLLNAAAREGATKAIAETGSIPAQLSKAEAYRLYGRSNVDRWIAEGLIIPAMNHGQASKKLIDRTKLDAVPAPATETPTCLWRKEKVRRHRAFEITD